MKVPDMWPWHWGHQEIKSVTKLKFTTWNQIHKIISV